MGKNKRKRAIRKTRANKILLRNSRDNVNKLSSEINKLSLLTSSLSSPNKKVCKNFCKSVKFKKDSVSSSSKITIIKKENKINSLKISKEDECPIKLTEEYISLLGREIPKSEEDINDVIEILLLQYNRSINQISDIKLNNNIKKVIVNLSLIFNYYIYDEEIIKLLKLVEICNDRTNNEPTNYLTTEYNSVLSQLKRTEEKVYFRLLNRLKNKGVQERFIVMIGKEDNIIENNKEEINIDKEYIDSILNDSLENLKIR